MKKYFFVSILAFASLGAAHCGKIAPTIDVGDPGDERFQWVLGKIEDDMGHHGIPGAAVAIVLDGKLAFAAGLGTKKYGDVDAVDASTLFRVASMSKMVLAATALELVAEGKLDLSRPVTDYVPLTLAAPYDPHSITVANLLTHTSAIADVNVAKTICPTGAGQSAAWFAAHGDQPLLAAPNDVWDYSNQGYSVAGWIVETVSGEAFEDAVRERVFVPANMTTATYDVNAATAGNHASGHQAHASYEPNAYDCAVTRPPAGVMASVIDYAHFAETLFASDGSMIDSASISSMETGHVDTDELPNAQEKYGYGLESVDGYKGVHVVMHTGSDLGYRSVFLTVPDKKFAAIIFYNDGSRSPLTVARDALDEFLGLRDVPAPDFTTAPSTWQKYAGTYVDPNTALSTDVTFDGDTLAWSLEGSSPIPLVQSAGDAFTTVMSGSTVDVTFYPDSAGNPTQNATQNAKWFVTRQGVGVRQ